MISFHSLNTIIQDILLEARQNNIAESDQLNDTQIEQWIIEYRAFLLKQDIDRGRDINPDYIQSIDNIPITNKNSSNTTMWEDGFLLYKTTIDIPNGIDFHFEDNILSIRDQYGAKIQLMSEKRALMQQSRRYTRRDTVAFKKDKRLFLIGNDVEGSINIRMVAEDPMDPAFGLSADDRYPIPANMVPTLKELIMKKELGYSAKSDKTNDGSDNQSK